MVIVRVEGGVENVEASSADLSGVEAQDAGSMGACTGAGTESTNHSQSRRR